MNVEQYQLETQETAIYPTAQGITYCALGLVSEAGEVAGIVKKVIRDSGGVYTTEVQSKLKKEVGDNLWYISQLCNEFGWSMGDLMAENINKLKDRKNRGVLSGSGDNR